MVACTYLYDHEVTNIKDKDLLALLNESNHIKSRYVVIEREYEVQRATMFKKRKVATHYSVYYRYDLNMPSNVQQLGCPGGWTYAAVTMYFIGLISGIDDVRTSKVIV